MFARFISFILHPIFIPLVGLYLVVNFDPYLSILFSGELLSALYVLTALCTIVLPMTNIFLMKRFGMISSYEMPDHKERIGPYISTLFFYCIAYFIIRRNSVLPESVYSIFMGSIVALLLVALISLKWKISSHATGFFGLIGALMGLFIVHQYADIYLLCILLIVGGMLMTARLQLGSHNLSQVLVGALLGFCCTFVPLVSGIYF